MNLPKLTDIDCREKQVIVRADLDVDPDGDPASDYRLSSLLPTLDYLDKQKAKIVLVGHRGRPKGKDRSLSLGPVSKKLEKLLIEKWGKKRVKNCDMYVMENLRFNAGEEVNDEYFAQHLAEKRDFYVNEAFSVSHREHASIVGLPKYLPHTAGLHFAQEVENLSRVLDQPPKPVVIIISGVKEDKLKYALELEKLADKILIGGRLPEQIHDFSPLRKNKKFVIASLMPDKEDITISAMEKFEKEIKAAGTIVVSGPLGKFEEEGHRQGTERVLTAVANSKAYKVAGGGDTVKAIQMLGLIDKFDHQGWISVGGGAMLEFLTKGTLPGIEALISS